MKTKPRAARLIALLQKCTDDCLVIRFGKNHVLLLRANLGAMSASLTSLYSNRDLSAFRNLFERHGFILSREVSVADKRQAIGLYHPDLHVACKELQLLFRLRLFGLPRLIKIKIVRPTGGFSISSKTTIPSATTDAIPMHVYTREGGKMRFRGTHIPTPDRYPANGFDALPSYIVRLLVPSEQCKGMIVSTPDGRKAFLLTARNSQVEACLTVEWRQEPVREKTVRAFFHSLGIAPSRDYLAGNGAVSDATRVLNYPLQGDVSQLTALTKRILQELCNISPTEALNIDYQDK
jgi:hypothetical protein